MHYTFDAFRICSIRCWGKEWMQHFMNAVIMHQNGGYNNAGAFRRSCIIIHFCWAAFVAYSIYQNLVCLLVCLAFRRVTMLLTLHSRCPSYASDFWLDCGLASALFWPVVLTHTHRHSAHSHLFTLAENPFGSPSLSPQRDDDSLRCRALCLHRRRDDPGSKAHRHQPVYSRELRHHDWRAADPSLLSFIESTSSRPNATKYNAAECVERRHWGSMLDNVAFCECIKMQHNVTNHQCSVYGMWHILNAVHHECSLWRNGK